MQADFAQKLRSALSEERLAGYESRTPGDGDLDTFCHYAWNLALGESLYPTLQCVEVVLRNAVHGAARGEFGNDSWFDDSSIINSRFEVEAIAKAKAKLQRQRKPLDPHRIVAELNFGFWTSLLDRRYEQILWPRLIRAAFPHMPRRDRTRRNLLARFNEIRKLRNRLFHHEPIWYWTDLEDKHEHLVAALNWMEPAIADLVTSLDRFPDVYTNGRVSVETNLRRFC